MEHAQFHLYSKRVVSQNPQISFKIITSSMHQNAGTKMHEIAAALDRVVHYIYHEMYKFSRVMRSEYVHIEPESQICFNTFFKMYKFCSFINLYCTACAAVHCQQK